MHPPWRLPTFCRLPHPAMTPQQISGSSLPLRLETCATPAAVNLRVIQSRSLNLQLALFEISPARLLLSRFLTATFGDEQTDLVGMMAYLAIAIGGTLGCWARYAMTNLVQSIYGGAFPYATLSINVIGSFLMGFLFVESLERLVMAPQLRIGILTGFLGGFTTFSTFAMETLLLAEQGETAKSVLYVVLSLVLGLFGAFFGAYIARHF
jgi:CrcB protein